MQIFTPWRQFPVLTQSVTDCCYWCLLMASSSSSLRLSFFPVAVEGPAIPLPLPKHLPFNPLPFLKNDPSLPLSSNSQLAWLLHADRHTFLRRFTYSRILCARFPHVMPDERNLVHSAGSSTKGRAGQLYLSSSYRFSYLILTSAKQ